MPVGTYSTKATNVREASAWFLVRYRFTDEQGRATECESQVKARNIHAAQHTAAQTCRDSVMTGASETAVVLSVRRAGLDLPRILAEDIRLDAEG